MKRMRLLFTVVTCTALAFAIVLVGGIQAGSGVEQKALSLQRLGPDPRIGPPLSLQSLVKETSAAVVAQIVKPGELKFEEVLVPHTTTSTVRGYAAYHVTIRDVVFNREGASAPPLTVGAQLELTQHVGRESAQAFAARQMPVTSGDECLLFLVLRGDEWEMLKWHLQFRKSRATPGVAEVLGQASELTPGGWLGPVPFIADRGVARPLWPNLVQEVRQLGKLPKVMSKTYPTLDELLEDGRAIDAALKAAARDARRLHKALGKPMATWVDDRVVWVQPEDIRVDDESSQERGPSEGASRSRPRSLAG